MNFVKLIAASALSLASLQAADRLSIRAFETRPAGLAEIVRDAEVDATLEGVRGCADAGPACADHRRILTLAKTAQAGAPLLLRLEGEGAVDEATVVLNGREVFHEEKLTLPVEIPVLAGEEDGVLHVTARVGVAQTHESYPIVSAASGKGVKFAAATATSAMFRFFTNVPEEGFWEVITGSNTGGRLIFTRSSCVVATIPVAQCPVLLQSFGYTDRSARGELLVTFVDYAGTLSSVGWIVNGRVRFQFNNVNAPGLIPQNVSTNPNDDNMYAFAIVNGKYIERRLPLGRR